jgi:hypothetical protein
MRQLATLRFARLTSCQLVDSLGAEGVTSTTFSGDSLFAAKRLVKARRLASMIFARVSSSITKIWSPVLTVTGLAS